MQISKSIMRTLSHHAIKTDRAFSKIITYRYTIRLIYCAIAMKDTHYKELNLAFMKQYSNIFFKILSSKLPSEDDSKYRIILKDDRSINGKLMRVSTRYWLAMKRFIDINLNVKRIWPSHAHISYHASNCDITQSLRISSFSSALLPSWWGKGYIQSHHEVLRWM